ncbi:MAG: acetamidase/formamidase family protein [Zavarzinella sp.]
MQGITRDRTKKYAFDWREPPELHVAPGEKFFIETWDASGGYFQSESDLAIPGLRPGFDRTPPLVNPIAGPVFVEGVSSGENIAVTIHSIEVGDFSWVAVGPGRGPLGDSQKFPDCSKSYTTKIFRHQKGPSGTYSDGSLPFSPTISWPITPFVGTIGVAPDREVTTSNDGQGEWGGNLDVRDVAAGNRIILPVFHAGALLSLGDVHASQGDTEFTGTAAETNSRVVLSIEKYPGTRVPFMRLEKEASIVALFAYRPLEIAVEKATLFLIEWLVKDYGFRPVDAYCLVSTCPDFRINVYQMCRIGKLNYVAGAEIPKRYLTA